MNFAGFLERLEPDCSLEVEIEFCYRGNRLFRQRLCIRLRIRETHLASAIALTSN